MKTKMCAFLLGLLVTATVDAQEGTSNDNQILAQNQDLQTILDEVTGVDGASDRCEVTFRYSSGVSLGITGSPEQFGIENSCVKNPEVTFEDPDYNSFGPVGRALGMRTLKDHYEKYYPRGLKEGAVFKAIEDGQLAISELQDEIVRKMLAKGYFLLRPEKLSNKKVVYLFEKI